MSGDVGPFPAILLDPPWPENGGGKIKRGADRHYPTIRRLGDIVVTIRDAPVFRPAVDAHMYMCATNNYLPWALQIIAELGFRYITNFPWVKPVEPAPAHVEAYTTKGRNFGVGQYARGCHELVLFAVRGTGYNVCQVHPPGHPKAGNRVTVRTDALVGVPRVLGPDGKVIHSAKPDAVRELVELRSKGPYLEMFARSRRPGWTCWGNEVDTGPGSVVAARSRAKSVIMTKAGAVLGCTSCTWHTAPMTTDQLTLILDLTNTCPECGSAL